MSGLRARFSHVAVRIFTFLAGQGVVQLLSAFIGLSMLRILTREQFALFSLAFGLQVTIGTLSDLGFSGAVLALAGPRHEDKRVLGEYIKSASVVRRMLVTVLSVIALIVVVVLHKLPKLPIAQLISLGGAIVVTLQFQAWASYYEAPLLLRNKLRQFYAPQIAGQSLRIVGLLILYWMHAVSVDAIIWLNTANVVLMGLSYRLMTRQWLDIPAKAPRESTKEMLRYLAPLLPGIIYQAFSGQITLFLAAIFAKVDQVADVAAVGRLGQLFIVLSMSNSILIGPMAARLHRDAFRKRYLGILLAVTVVGTVIYISGILVPGWYILILGPKYQNLQNDVRLVVQAAAISYVSGAMWSVAASRKWIFWWSGALQIGLLTSIQVVSAFFVRLDTAEGVLAMNVYVAWGSLLVQSFHSLKGMTMEAKESRALRA